MEGKMTTNQNNKRTRAALWKDTDFGGGELVSQEVQVVLECLQVAGCRGQVLLEERLGLVNVVLQHDVRLFWGGGGGGDVVRTTHKSLLLVSSQVLKLLFCLTHPQPEADLVGGGHRGLAVNVVGQHEVGLHGRRGLLKQGRVGESTVSTTRGPSGPQRHRHQPSSSACVGGSPASE